MAAVEQQVGVAQEQRVVLHNVSWETYERLLADHASASAPRFAYDRGELEITSPMPVHERYSWAIDRIIEAVAIARDMNIENLGSATFRRGDLERGFEADSCFYIRNEAAVRNKERIDLEVDPPPDIVIEIDLSRSSMPKLGIFAALGVPEVWRFDGRSVSIHVLRSGAYVESPASSELSGLTASGVSTLIERLQDIERSPWLRSVRTWAVGISSE